MKKIDILTAVGLIGGIILLGWAMTMGASIMLFWDLPSVFITFGGAFAGLLITFSVEDVKKMGPLFVESFKEATLNTSEIISTFATLSKKARRDGLLSLEDEISQIEDPFLKKGLQMVVDGIEPETIQEILELELEETESRHERGASTFSVLGAYGPGFGMIGTLIGLIQMLANLQDASMIAAGMGKALITTLYGSLLANVICQPIAANLKNKSARESAFRGMMIEGILSIQSGVNPRIVEEKLITFMSPAEKLVYMKANLENNEGVA